MAKTDTTIKKERTGHGRFAAAAGYVAAPQRVTLRRTRGWRMPDNTVKVDRTSKTWGNPFKIGAPHPRHGTPMTRGETIALYERHLQTTVGETGFALAAEAQTYLRGKNLACWCADLQECHADVLLRVANEPHTTTLLSEALRLPTKIGFRFNRTIL